MQTRRDELKNNVDDAYLALLMDEFCEAEGAKLLTESDLLNSDPDAAVSKSQHDRIYRLVDQHFAKEVRTKHRMTARRVFRCVLMVATIAIVLFTTAFAVVEEFRVDVLNFKLKMQEKYSLLVFDASGEDAQATRQPESTDGEGMLFCDGQVLIDFDLTDFEVLENDVDEMGAYAYLRTNEGSQTIALEISTIVVGMDFQVDTENADLLSEIEIGGNQGYLIVKGNRSHVVWADFENNKILEVITNGLGKDYTLYLAEHVFYVGG